MVTHIGTLHLCLQRRGGYQAHGTVTQQSPGIGQAGMHILQQAQVKWQNAVEISALNQIKTHQT